MKVYYVAGILFAGIFGAFSMAHASEAPVLQVSAYTYAQPVAYNRNVMPMPQKRRIVREAYSAQPRAVLVNGTYRMQTQKTTRRVRNVAVPAPLRTTPNLFKTGSQQNMPVMFTREALSAR